MGRTQKANGKKNIRNQTAIAKLKSENETGQKELISELEKEILTIKINEYEKRLKRKKELCSCFEKDIAEYNTLFKEKQLIKSESMKLLNNAFEDFTTEIRLLDQDMIIMQNKYKELSNKTVCRYREEVEKLSLLKSKLEEKLHESEKSIEQIPVLKEKLESLTNQSLIRRDNFINELKNMAISFEMNLKRIEDDLHSIINKAINGDSSKLDLLSKSSVSVWNSVWLDSNLNCLMFLAKQNDDLKKCCIKMSQSVENNNQLLKSIILKDILNNVEQGKNFIDKNLHQSSSVASSNISYLLQKENFKILQQYKTLNRDLHTKIKYVTQLEKEILAIETFRKTSLEQSSLVQQIIKAGNILKTHFKMPL